MSSEASGGQSPEQPGGSSAGGQDQFASLDQTDFSSPAPAAWSQAAPDSWAHEPGPAEVGAADTWPGEAAQQPTTFGAPVPAASDPWTQQSAQQWSFGQQPAAGFPAAGQSPSGQFPPGQYPPGQYPPGQYAPGQGAAGQYGYHPQFFAPATARTNKAAIWALVCGIGQFVLGLTLVGNILGAIPAIILGAIALKQTRLRGERGRGLAIAGLVLGILGVLYFLLILIVIITVGVHTSNSGTS